MQNLPFSLLLHEWLHLLLESYFFVFSMFHFNFFELLVHSICKQRNCQKRYGLAIYNLSSSFSLHRVFAVAFMFRLVLDDINSPRIKPQEKIYTIFQTELVWLLSAAGKTLATHNIKTHSKNCKPISLNCFFKWSIREEHMSSKVVVVVISNPKKYK